MKNLTLFAAALAARSAIFTSTNLAETATKDAAWLQKVLGFLSQAVKEKLPIVKVIIDGTIT